MKKSKKVSRQAGFYNDRARLERKFVTVAAGGDAIGTSATFYDLTAVAQGLDDGNRVGRQIEAESVVANFYFEKDLNASATSSDDIRIVIIYARDNDTWTWDDIFVSSQLRSVPRPQISWKGHYVQDAKFTILYDCYIALAKTYMTVYSESIDVKVRRPVLYKGTTSADVSSGRIMAMLKSSNNTAYQPDFTALMCLYYTDA